uniref:Defective in cullin neddylation protein n=2 Tax=Rhizophora mucronata TaxID=61149 RepID=A0A2P2JQ43_RHIMU
MDSPNPNRVGIFEIYRRYCDIRSGKAYKDISNGQDDETQWSKFLRDALAQLLKFVESSLYSRISIFDELLMLKLNLGCMVSFICFKSWNRIYEHICCYKICVFSFFSFRVCLLEERSIFEVSATLLLSVVG